METRFDWKRSSQLNNLQILLAFALPSAFAFFGFRVILPWLVESGLPKVIGWGLVASFMLLILCIIGVLLIRADSVKLNVSIKERLLLRKVPLKTWLICLTIMVLAITLSNLLVPIIPAFSEAMGLSIPGYMPFWLDPSINPLETELAVLSPGYELKGNYLLIVLMAITLLLNILAEEIYFRAWLLPKMQSLGKLSWSVNGLLFALYHSFQLWLFPMLLVVSLATTFTVHLSKSIIPAFVVHIIANFLFAILGILMLVFG